ncbi:hypothetical protein LCGC14_1272710 [marine sediment metagenome]|uniref:Uncharacterized protein n=1 Tax=marine sediment metagenome TaxID=412755 RepID=A0A0F9KZG4_9ZZZZ
MSPLGSNLPVVKHPVIEVENGDWQLMAQGKKPWAAIPYDLSDPVLYSLLSFEWEKEAPLGRQPDWQPKEAIICFRNKADGEILSCRYNGWEVVDWAPGWVFILVSGILGGSGEDSDEATYRNT